MDHVTKQAFTVIGKAGSTQDGADFIQQLWHEANNHFHEVACMAKRDSDGVLTGIWGVMSDFAHTYQPWENDFREGLYLAGVECIDDAHTPEGWEKWTIPGYEYIVAEQSATAFRDTLARLHDNHLPLVGAVHDFTDPKTGKGYMYFPIRKLEASTEIE